MVLPNFPSGLLLLSALSGLSQAQWEPIRFVNGRMRLLGSSFGIPGVNATWDYVIVGGGNAGLVAANRLAANGTYSVAVIEAGGFYEIENSNRTQIPAYSTYNTTNSLEDIQPLTGWGDITLPQATMNGRRLHYPAGRMLGGGSSKNYGTYIRPTRGSMQRWAEAVGDSSYEWDEVLPFFQRSAQFTPPNYDKRNDDEEVSFDPAAFSESGGPLQLTYGNWLPPSSPFIAQAYEANGLTYQPGLQSGNLSGGFSDFVRTIDPLTQTRSSSQSSFLRDSIHNSDLIVYTETYAERILFDESGRATGVRVSSGEEAYILTANREVILAAGAFRSPQLLMLSGIGPADTLAQFNIPVVSNLEGVGRELQDHPIFGATYRVNVTTQSRLTWDREYALAATEEYLNNQTGPLTLAGGTNAAFEDIPSHLRSRMSNETIAELDTFPEDWPEVEYITSNTGVGPITDQANYIRMNVGLMVATSRGNISINSTDARDGPLINLNFLDSRMDQEVCINALRRVREFMASSGIVMGDEIAPGSEVETDDQLLAYLRQTVGQFSHASSTCPMGREGDENAVVDSAGRVFGVTGLRIIDASTFPFVLPGHTQSVVYMLAEKLVESIMSGN